MSFLEWLTGMALMFWGWSFPIGFGIDYINNQNGNIYIGIFICSLAIPIEIALYRLNKKFKEKSEQKEKAYKQVKEPDLIKSSKALLECRQTTEQVRGDTSKDFYAYMQALEQERIKAEKERLERIKASPVTNLSPLEFEEYTKQYLEERNYRQVHLTRTSGDFGADVIAIAPDNVRVCIQCKKYSSPVGVSAIQEIHSAKSYYKCRRASVVTTSSGFTKNAIQLSERNNVSLFAYDDCEHEFKPMNRCAQSLLSALELKTSCNIE